MNKTKLSYRWKVHLFFAGGLLLVVCGSFVINLFSGQSFSSATTSAFRQIRPVEYIMYFLFWYWISRGQKPISRPAFTTLNLGGSKT